MLSSPLIMWSLFIYSVTKFTNLSAYWQTLKISRETSNSLHSISRSIWSCKILDFFSTLCILSVLDFSIIASRHWATTQQVFKLLVHTFTLSVFVDCPIMPASTDLSVWHLHPHVWTYSSPWNRKKLDDVLPLHEMVAKVVWWTKK